MAAPTSTAEFLDLVRKSGVVDGARLDALAANAATPAAPLALARQMVRDGLLTEFQAKNLLAGKYRRLVIGGKYKLLELIGAGGMGAVYLCEHTIMHRLVALKVLPINRLESQGRGTLERFYREARAVGQFDHPNIIRAHDIGQDEGLHFLVLEYVDGASLQEIVSAHGPMDPVRAAHYVAQAAIGLDHAHAAGLIHRDIKPGNVLLDRGGTVKVLDLGLARFFNASAHDDLTAKYDEGSILGTADYLAPEQGMPGPIDTRVDVYSLGATFYFLLAGKAPFEEGTISQKMLWHQARNPKPISELRADVPPGMLAIVERMMAKAPGERYQTMHEIADALQPWTSQPIAPPPEAEMPKRNRGPIKDRRPTPAPRSPRPVPGRPKSRPPDPSDTPAGSSHVSETTPLPRPAPPLPPPSFPTALSRRAFPLVPVAIGTAAILGLSGALAWALWLRERPGATPPIAEVPARTTPVDTAPAKVDSLPVIVPAQAHEFENERRTVRLVVNNVGSAPGLFFLNTERDRNSPTNFVVVVSDQLLSALRVGDKSGLEERYGGRTVLATGVLTKYRGRLEIKLEKASDLVRVDDNTP